MAKYYDDYSVVDDALFQDYVTDRGLSKNSIRTYKIALDKFCKANKETLENMFHTFEKEQKSKVEDDNTITEFNKKDPYTSISKCFRKFVGFCKKEDENKKKNKNTTINLNVQSIRTFLENNGIKLPEWKKLPNDSDNWVLLKKEDIEYIMNELPINYMAITTFLLSTGMREVDACNLTIGDFMEATSGHHDFVDVEEFIDKAPQDMFGYWEFEPQKTKKHHIICKTFNSPESSNYILQNLRRVKNDYLPKINKKKNKNLKISKKDALFGSKKGDYLKKLRPQSVTDTFCKRNKKLESWHITKIDQKIENGELSAEDREDEIKKIPKIHPHALRKYFITTVSKYGDLRTCLVLEGHQTVVSTDKSYVTIGKDDVEKVYNKALKDLTIEPIDPRLFTNTELEELKQESQENKRTIERLTQKLEESEKEKKKYKEELKEVKKSTIDIQEQVNIVRKEIEDNNILKELYNERIPNYSEKSDLIDKSIKKIFNKVITKNKVELSSTHKNNLNRLLNEHRRNLEYYLDMDDIEKFKRRIEETEKNLEKKISDFLDTKDYLNYFFEE